VTRPPYRWPDPDRDYANGAFIPGSAILPELWASKAAAFREAHAERAELDLSYGPGARQKLDLFLPEGKPRGVVVFIHGGYWHLFSKSHWSHLAAGPLALGFAVAIPGYTLAPEARLSEMTAEIAQAAWFVAHGAGQDGHHRPFRRRSPCRAHGLGRYRRAGRPRRPDLAPDRAWAADGDGDERDPRSTRTRPPAKARRGWPSGPRSTSASGSAPTSARPSCGRRASWPKNGTAPGPPNPAATTST
jgi:hypothetical protein